MAEKKLNVKKIALTAGIYAATCTALVTICSLLKIPGFPEFTNILVSIYGFYGYSVSVLGIFIGAFWGFVEGFVHAGFFSWLYNRLR